MIPKRLPARMVVAFTLLALWVGSPPRASEAGPISAMKSKYRQWQQTRIPPMSKPFSSKPVKDLNSPGLAQKFRQRFAAIRGSSGSGGSMPLNKDSSITRTGR